MPTLPREVLVLVIRHLNRDELLQCQLTCKEWRKASSVFLYTVLDIKSKEKAALYARTISESPELGRYLKGIHFCNVFYKNRIESPVENLNVLEAVIRHCPNISRVDNTDIKGFQFWTQLMHAATQGQLRNLNYLPESSSVNLASYIYTALSFKNSLAQLWLIDDDGYFGPRLNLLGAYQTLCDQIDQFKNLQSLTFNFSSDKQLSYYDGLIDKCQHLKEVDFVLNIDMDIQPLNDPVPAFRPRPDIDTLMCNWKLIDAESQLEYVMCKFPNLQKLMIILETDPVDDIANSSGPTLIKFIRFALSVPYFKVEIDIGIQDLISIWNELMKTEFVSKKITTGCQSSRCATTIEISSGSEMKVFFPSNGNDDDDDDDEDDNNNDDIPPHIQFFSEVGGTIQSLTIGMSDRISCMEDDDIPTIAWLYDVLQRCPFIEEIKTRMLRNVPPIHHTAQYPSVKKLIIKFLDYSGSDYSLDSLSLCLPNLRQLYINLYHVSGTYNEPIVIHMPYTSLDLLIWNETELNIFHFRGTEIYIKLKTDVGTKFYVGIRSLLFPIDSKRYGINTKNIRFDISCKKLKEFRVRRRIAPESDANLVF